MTHQRAGLGERSVATIGRVQERLARINAKFAIMKVVKVSARVVVSGSPQRYDHDQTMIQTSARLMIRFK
jgi:hypothetical protein